MEEYKLYNLQVMTRSEIGTRGTHVLAPGRNPEEAEQDYLREYPSKRAISPRPLITRGIPDE